MRSILKGAELRIQGTEYRVKSSEIRVQGSGKDSARKRLT